MSPTDRRRAARRRLKYPAPRAAQRGIALLTALFVVALAIIAATALVSANAIAVRRTGDLQDSEQAWWYALGAESWVKSVLERDAKANKTDSLAEAWAVPQVSFPIDTGNIRGHIEDLQGHFNLNTLANQSSTGSPNGNANGNGTNNGSGGNNASQSPQAQFQRLIENIDGIDPFVGQNLAAAIRDWVDSDDERSGAGGFEDGDYLGLDVPYRAANQPMRSLSELLAVHGMDLHTYDLLRPYVAALPTTPPTPININTAPLPVLLSLSSQVNVQKAQAFVESRLKNPAEKVDEVVKDGLLPAGVPTSSISVSSHYFMLQQEVVVGSARVALYSVVFRPDGGTPLVIAHYTDTE